MSTNDNFGVFEVGMSKPGEILKLSALVRPHIATITNISEAHLENFQNINGIAKAKSEIIYNIEKGGSVILNKDDKFFDYFKKIAEKKHIKVVSFGYSKKSDVTYDSLKTSQGGYILQKPASEIKISNIIAAVDEKVRTLNCKKESKKGCNNRSTKCITHNLWDNLEQHINNFFEKVKLEDLVLKKKKN